MGLDKGQGHMGHTGCHTRLYHKNQSSKEVMCAGGCGTCADVELGIGNGQQLDLGCSCEMLEDCLDTGGYLGLDLGA